MSRKALFFDVDGTLVDDKTKDVTPGTFEAIREARANGHMALINTGRTIKITEGLARIFHMDGMLCGCGTQIIIDGETIFEHRIPLDKCNEIKDLLKEYRLDVILEAQEGLYFNAAPFLYTDDWQGILRTIQGLDALNFNSLDNKTFVFDKFCVQRPEGEGAERFDEFISKLPDFECIDRGGIFKECVPKGYSKGTAIEFVMDKYGIAPEDAYVFGDSANDMAMFQSKAANRILMKTHSKILEPYATYVTDDPLDDGLAKAMKYYHII